VILIIRGIFIWVSLIVRDDVTTIPSRRKKSMATDVSPRSIRLIYFVFRQPNKKKLILYLYSLQKLKKDEIRLLSVTICWVRIFLKRS
jgi:hypothetical protein